MNELYIYLSYAKIAKVFDQAGGGQLPTGDSA